MLRLTRRTLLAAGAIACADPRHALAVEKPCLDALLGALPHDPPHRADPVSDAVVRRLISARASRVVFRESSSVEEIS